MDNKDCFRTSDYIQITEQTNEERTEEFLRTINGAIDSFTSKRYGKEAFAYIISVACNNVSDLYELDAEENVEAPTFLSEEKAYADFEQAIKDSADQYSKAQIDGHEVYQDVNRAYNNLIANLNQDKPIQKVFRRN